MEKKVETRRQPVSATTLKDLGALAAEKRKEIETARFTPPNSLLAEARNSYLASLDAVSATVDKQQKGASGKSAESYLKTLRAQTSYREAVQQSLKAQRQYYASMLMWASTVNSSIPDKAELAGSINPKQWSSYPLLVKNKLMADLIQKRGRWTEYYPQDLAGAIDGLLSSGEASRLSMGSINDLADVVTGTNAVREGDFWSIKSRLYSEETLPQLPFFLPPEN